MARGWAANPTSRSGILVVAVWFVSAGSAGATDVADLVDQLSGANYRDLLDNRLYTRSGDNRGFQWNAAQDRYLPTADHDAARNNILGHFTALGLEASLDPFSFVRSGKTYAGCNNVLGVLPGRIDPLRVYFVGGHYDSVSNPGADDNASGVAGVMEAARVLSQHPFACTIVFAAWDGEEMGLKGSWHWVDTEDESVVDGVANLDMIAYNHNGDDTAVVYGEASWRTKWAGAAARYSEGITPIVSSSQVRYSDHWPFEDVGRPAGGIIEDGLPLPNPNYHKQSDSVDTPGYLDYDYALEILKSAVGLIFEEAGLLLPGDADTDGDVDASDYLTLKRGLGTPAGAGWAEGDFDADEDVDRDDFLALQEHGAETLVFPSAGGGAPVPEPAGLAILAALLAAGLPRRRYFPSGRCQKLSQ